MKCINFENILDVKILIDFGNFWEMLAAIGTIAAVIVSLYLANSGDKVKLRYYVIGLKNQGFWGSLFHKKMMKKLFLIFIITADSKYQ